MRTLALVPMVATFFACTDVADDRAADDEAVGHYADPSTRIDVDGGLAAIREVKPGSIVFWSSAPEWSATVTVDDTLPLRIELRNIIPGSRIIVEGPDGESVAVDGEAGPIGATASDSGATGVSATDNGADGAAATGVSATGVSATDDAAAMDGSATDGGLGGADHGDRRPATERVLYVTAPRSPMRWRLRAPQGTSSVYRFAVLSDIQEAIDAVQDIYRRIAQESPPVDFVLGAGDLTRRGSREELARFEAELAGLPVPYYCTLGNHELGETPPVYQELFGRANLHFHYRGVAFSLLDSGSATLAPRSLDWLRAWLDEDRARVHVFATHYPPIDPIGVRNGAFASRAEAHQLLAELAEGHVDLCLHGHIHSYYSYSMAGIPSYIAGGGGAIPERFDKIGRHYLVVQVEADERGRGAIQSVRLVAVD